MASLRYPDLNNLPFRSPVNVRIPYLLTVESDYPEGLNFFLQEGLDRVAATPEKDVQRKYEISDSLVKAASYSLLNYLNFQEHISQFSELLCENWRDLRPIHTRLWAYCMVKGFWTDEFFATGNAIPLSQTSTIRPRVSWAQRAWSWMDQQGLIDLQDQSIDEHTFRKQSKFLIYTFESMKRAHFGTYSIGTKYKKRNSPGNSLPLSKKQLRALLEEVRPGGAYLAILAIYMVGMRLSEIATNSIMPGERYIRPDSLQSGTTHRFRSGPYLTKHDLRDDSMIGVMPSAEVAFGTDEEAANKCRFRIIGKGPKVRLVYVPPYLMRLFWHYAWKEREQILEKNGISNHGRPAHFLLNRFGAPLSANAIYRELKRAADRANQKLADKIVVDAHTLRHTYACTYLEAVISAQAIEDGFDPLKLNLHQIENYGQAALIILQDHLGHAELATTMRYLKQLASGDLGLQFQRLFNEHIDGQFLQEAA